MGAKSGEEPMPAPAATHPLSPLLGDEIEAAAALLTACGQLDMSKALFAHCCLLDPPKAAVLGWGPGSAALPRVVRMVGYDDAGDGGFEADVTLGSGAIDVKRVPATGQVTYSADIMTVMTLVFQCPEYHAAMAKRGLEVDPAKIQIDPWPAGGFAPDCIPAGHRAMRAISFVKSDETDNGYAKPVHGLIVHVDVTAKTVALVEDHGVSTTPAGREGDRYDVEHLPIPRGDLKPIEITQPEGVSFTVTEGNKISWLDWEFRTHVHPTHALELSQVSIQGRPLLYRASLSDMVVPYGDTDPMHAWKHVLDASEYGMGTMAESLELGCDCLGEIVYLDSYNVGATGEASHCKNAICVHEEDAGIAWRHRDGRGAGTLVRRNRRLVVSSWFTVGNYDYGIAYKFYPDGNLEVDFSLTGIVGVSSFNDGSPASGADFAPRIAPDIVSPLHQHLFSLRLDWDLDGSPNSVVEQEVEPVPMGPSNPQGTQFHTVTRTLETELEAKRLSDNFKNRHWKVVSSTATNPSTENATGYKVLVPAAHRNTLLAHPDSPVAGRASFALYNLWATPFTEGELSAAGDHTSMSVPGLGLPHFTRNDRSIVDCDLVTWHTLGLTHVPRAEDWPVMPTEHATLMLFPSGFFERNPVLDLPEGNGSNAAHCAKL